MTKIKQLLEDEVPFYPVTAPEAIQFSDGDSLIDKSYVTQPELRGKEFVIAKSINDLNDKIDNSNVALEEFKTTVQSHFENVSDSIANIPKSWKAGNGSNSVVHNSVNASHASGTYSVAIGKDSIANGAYSVAEGSSVAIGEKSHSEGNFSDYGESVWLTGSGTTYTYNFDHGTNIPIVGTIINKKAVIASIDESNKTITTTATPFTYGLNDAQTSTNFSGAVGNSAHSEGMSLASGNYSHSEGSKSHAKGVVSHAENYSFAVGAGSHSENYSLAAGELSHSEGEGLEPLGVSPIDNPSKGWILNYTNGSVSYQEADPVSIPIVTFTINDSSIINRLLTAVAFRLNDVLYIISDITNNGNIITIVVDGLESAGQHILLPEEGKLAIFSGGAFGRASHVEGYHTFAHNDYEHAQGRYNKSVRGLEGSASTLSSIGIGSQMFGRKNAVEVMSDGTVYIKGIGTYDGTNPISGTNDVVSVINALTTRISTLEGNL